ncbi:3'-5' exoribonuclease [Entomoplasma freundtii]|uniref:3'-5' exoribonuclease n=2 Tax=Entomoplasma freundtii TaxID=74700 RepID=A0A2K8NR13_9MOLU|nr:3'-5' exoribonuclease [Entomoplasma freundtii]TDY56872.1 3'-5' exoribonuclease [Entomoplasma freundtii]
MKKLHDLKANENDLELLVRIERATLLSGANGQNYLILNLVDPSGRLEARRWMVNDYDKEHLVPNQYIHLTKAVTSEYRGQLQLKINEYAVLTENDLTKFGFKSDDFFVKAPLDVEKHYQDFKKLVGGFENEVYRKVTLHLLKKYEKEFLRYPAAIFIHHNVHGGLFWHSYTLVKNILAIRDNYSYANIDWELLIAGAILHDLGKVVEINNIGANDYSLEGKLIGHISLGNSQVVQAAHELGFIDYENGRQNASVTLLEHLILASHGKHDFGSPVEPHTIEAVILSTFDNLDARIYRTNEEISKVNLFSWTPKLPSEDNKMFYHHFDKVKAKTKK